MFVLLTIRNCPTLIRIVSLLHPTRALIVRLRLTHLRLVIYAPAAILKVCADDGVTLLKNVSTDGNVFTYCEVFAERRQYGIR
jgi:hypothetical protein